MACASGYLDPRPNAATIHAAYTAYYTHGATASSLSEPPQGAFERVRNQLANGYVNWRYGARRGPASHWGILAAALLPLHRSVLDREYRHLARPKRGCNALLDVGCGNGSYLALAQQCGWDVVGVEPDPTAARTAAQHGITVIEGGIERLAGRDECFDAITLSHVIEHVHAPLQLLERCHQLLKPGGTLWIETPNMHSLGHRLFGAHWRGLEAPRHLVLFSADALRQALLATGFERPKPLPAPSPRLSVFQQSWSMANGRPADALVTLPPALARRARWGTVSEALCPGGREFLTLRAHKPKHRLAS
jgi:SAM-dependent methyltransferase